MSKIKTVVLICLALGLHHVLSGQECQTVLLLKKGNSLELKDDMTSFSTTGFYMYRNCMYELETIDGNRYTARLLDIKKDSLEFSDFMNENAARTHGASLKRFTIHVRDLSKLFLISDRSLGLYEIKHLRNFDFMFDSDTVHCRLHSIWEPIYYGETAETELAPHLTAQGIGRLYEAKGEVYYYYGRTVRPYERIIDSTFTAKRVFYLPPFEASVDEINGLAFGFMAEPSNVKNSLKCRGLSVEILSLGLFAPIFGSFLGRDRDFYNEEADETIVWQTGLMINPGGAIEMSGGKELRGVYVAGGVTMVKLLNGCGVSGVNSQVNTAHGVLISGLRNQVQIGRGLQIALVNSCRDFRGIQIGLWNKNQKRSLPFINWCFKD